MSLPTPELAPATAQGRRERTARARLALPGGRHDRLIRLLALGLPLGIGVLAAFLVMAPLYSGGDASFVLDKNKVERSHERLKIAAAQYRGQDDKGQPFTLDAGSALQRTSAEKVVELARIDGRLQLADGPATIHADRGTYDMTGEQLHAIGPITALGPKGWRLDTQDATADLKTRTLASGGGTASGTLPQGSFTAARMHADLESRTVTLDGHAHLHIAPARTK